MCRDWCGGSLSLKPTYLKPTIRIARILPSYTHVYYTEKKTKRTKTELHCYTALYFARSDIEVNDPVICLAVTYPCYTSCRFSRSLATEQLPSSNTHICYTSFKSAARPHKRTLTLCLSASVHIHRYTCIGTHPQTGTEFKFGSGMLWPHMLCSVHVRGA